MNMFLHTPQQHYLPVFTRCHQEPLPMVAGKDWKF